ncbi:sugar transferase [Aquabacterium sp. CECT 9606]|uniref:sugar transferase n=1 Tax=Aquabacterium sp. CECT 9606 TaxID=2845822 RepID=UPI001E28405B|nr:sugar transferase [Aquabacterium sp. CECT 9606]CAH0352529.1 UDP-N-acetylgalactosamine-undecaprenyl-phosphate N-acetylgalactosaminephosphotransferase [Aquabacterium sp. CECT 9606]
MKHEVLYEVAKRIFDVAIVLALLPLVLLLVLVCGLLIRLQSPGPLLLFQIREGRHGRCFELLKLRTMHMDSEARLKQHLDADPSAREQWERYFCLPRDPRVAGSVADFCRRYSIDEVPQLWNVLLGHMSLVGPRPMIPADARRFFSDEVRQLRLQVKPGLTGLWQATRVSKKDMLDSMALRDLDYLKRRSLVLDLWICLRTFKSVLSGGGQY